MPQHVLREHHRRRGVAGPFPAGHRLPGGPDVLPRGRHPGRDRLAPRGLAPHGQPTGRRGAPRRPRPDRRRGPLPGRDRRARRTAAGRARAARRAPGGRDAPGDARRRPGRPDRDRCRGDGAHPGRRGPGVVRSDGLRRRADRDAAARGRAARPHRRQHSGAIPAFLFAQALPSAAMRASLDEDPAFQHVVGLWGRAKGAILGVGAPTPTRDALARGIPVEDAVFDQAAGDVCLNFFAADGSPIEFPGSERMVRTSREVLAGVPHAVGVAVGSAKVPSIIGAVRAGMINELVTDAVTARALLDALA
nr:sugar-binding domain-containing protein [Curtobacterium sp. Csp1]